MPALYRMPIVYLLALFIAAGWGLTRLGNREATSVEVSLVAPTVAATPAPAEPEKIAPVPPEPSDGILRTAEGLRRKVVVKDLDLVCRRDPDDGPPVGSRLDYFAIRYLYGETPPGRPRMFQIGPREGPPQGWVPESAVVEWDTRLMARPTARNGRPPLVLFREKSCLLDRLAGRACPKHGDRCPIEGEEPEGTSDDAPAAGLPILSSESIPQPSGPERTILEVASLVHDRAPIVPPKEPPPDLRPGLRQINIAFVIDTTASMQSSIDAARRLAETLVENASKQLSDVTLRLALVEYRDAATEYGFRARVASGFTDPSGFREALGKLTVAKHRDGSVDEAVFDGLAAALPPDAATGRIAAAERLNWPAGRAGDLATKMIVLLGDAPDHDKGLTRAEHLAAIAKSAGISIATVAIDRPDLRSAGEETRYRAQWQTLAKGSFRPLDRDTEYSRPTPPVVVSLGQADDLAVRLQAIIDDRIEHARQLAALAAAEAEKRLQEYVNSQGLTLDQVHPVLVDLHRGETGAPSRPDPRFGTQRAPSVRKGWIAERIGDDAMVTIEILMSRDELDTLIRELTAVQQAAQGDAQDVADLLRIGTAAAAGESAFLAEDRGGLTFAEHLHRRQGLPPARSDSLLRRTQADLLQADDLDRRALNDRLGSTLRALISRRNAPDWDDPNRLIEGMGLVPFSLLDF
jgi:hypothetical protein